MKVRVSQGESVLHRGVWYNQGEILDVGDIGGDLKDKVSAFEQYQAKAKQEKKEEE